MSALWLWRHPRANHGAGRCIGRTDLPVDRRRAKRLAHRIRHAARRHGLPPIVWTSPLQRCCQVGRWLRDWGWDHRVEARLSELDFGDWDGRAWAEIPREALDRWAADLRDHAPGGGESQRQLHQRVQDFLAEHPQRPLLIVAHAGVMQVLQSGLLDAHQWPAPPAHGALRRLGR